MKIIQAFSTAKRIAAISFIYLCTAIGWAILGATIFSRTYSADPVLDQEVASTWGDEQSQKPPRAFTREEMEDRQSIVNGQGEVVQRPLKKVIVTDLPLEQTRATVKIDLQPRQKGLLWFSTYAVDFEGNYLFRNEANEEKTVTFELPYPASHAIYDNLLFSVDGAPLNVSTSAGEPGGTAHATGTARVPAHGAVHFVASYHSQGKGSWSYSFGDNISQVRNFQLLMTTNFQRIDFPESSLSPTGKRPAGDGWQLEWNYKSLISGARVAVAMPQKLQPGPLAGKISLFAPVSLFFFFFIIYMITTLRRIPLHPMNYLFLAAAFFSFHLLLAYLVDHLSIHVSFLVCSIVSVFLVVSYLRLVVGDRFAFREAAGAQIIYLVLFSYAFFFEGFTGLTLTIGAILTLFVLMQVTGRIDWQERLSASEVQV